MPDYTSNGTAQNPDVANIVALTTYSTLPANSVTIAFHDDDEPQLIDELLATARVRMMDDLAAKETGERIVVYSKTTDLTLDWTETTANTPGNITVIYNAANDTTVTAAAFDTARLQIADFYANKSS